MHTKRLSLALGACVLALAVTPVASASAHETRSATVKFSDLDPSTSAGAKSLYERIVNRARILCGYAPDASDIGGHDAWNTCFNEAVDGAVGRLNVPMVTALNGGHSTAATRLADSR